MIGATINLWNPVHVAGFAVIMTALLLGMVHGITPDEHTWPITFSYAIGSYSTRKGLRSGLIFSAAFTLQRALASELAYLGFSRFLTYGNADYAIYVVVGALMVWAGVLIVRKGRVPFHFHLHIPWLNKDAEAVHTGQELTGGTPVWVQDPRPWMPALHGFIAGWGFGAFAIIIYTVLAPAMPSAALGWVPGAMFGVGTTIIQVLAGAVFGRIASRRGLSPEAIRHVALTVAGRTLTWGGGAFVVGGLFGLAFPGVANLSVATGIHIHNLDQIGLPIFLVMFSVVGIGVTTLIQETRAWTRRERAARATAGNSV
ncbi:MAG: hypothetical protein ACYDC5_07300 [Candidatus Dormibacteria bacterium]